MSIISSLNQYGAQRAPISAPFGGKTGSNAFLVPQSKRHVEIFDDFIHTSVCVAAAGEGQWDITISSGSTVQPTDEHGGGMFFNLDGGDDDAAALHSPGEWLLMDLDKSFAFETRVKNALLTGSMFFGFTTVATQGDANATLLGVDHCGFHLDGTANIEFGYSDGTTATDADTGVDLVADTYTTLGFTYDAVSRKMRSYVDGVFCTESTPTSGTAPLPNTEVRPMIAVKAEGTTQPDMTVDYIYVVAEL